MRRSIRRYGLTLAVLLAVADSAPADPWSRARIDALPDSAFAAIETTPYGRRRRHLPHHDETGVVDPAHLAAARARWGQVKWLDPGAAEVARRHLEEHGRKLGSRDQRRRDSR
ncbi:MAG TPA: hypothetical protein VFO18_12160 [Methylomirabilota bacterium]|nr:hypothetical protein [Methylomirabilota bacterium]